MRHPGTWLLAAVVTLLALWGGPLHASATDDPFEMSLEEILDIEVFSVSRKSERLLVSPSAVHVITADEIRRSGMTTVAELLRMVPGMSVSQVNGGSWAVSSRGGQSQFDSKLLVMRDGRSIYTPMFAGVYWDLQDLPVEDIEQIEVIRGPGASLWGVNAVNGVINILTRDSRDTEGSYLSVSHGNMERAAATVRQGFALGSGIGLRLSAQFRDYGPTQGVGAADSTELHDRWRGGGIHGRMDWKLSERDSLQITFARQQSDREDVVRIYDSAYTNPLGTPVKDQEIASQTHAAALWRRQLGASESLEISGYADQEGRRSPRGDQHIRTFDLGMQHSSQPVDRVGVTWGLGARHYRMRLEGSPEVQFDRGGQPGGSPHAGERLAIYSGFGQASFELVDSVLRLTLGSKLSWNGYTGWEAQPSARLMWVPRENHHVWAAISRAIRTPSMADTDISLVTSVLPSVNPSCALVGGGANCPIYLRGNEHLDSEVLMAYEAGWRWQPSSVVSFDAALFYMDYENVISTSDTPTVVGSEFLLSFNNREEAHRYGAEVGVIWQLRPWWTLRAAWWGVQQQRSGAHSPEGEESTTPHHLGYLINRFDLGADLELDLALYSQGRREFAANAVQAATKIDGHHRFDVRVAWKPRPGLELSVVAQDLFDRQDQEFALVASPQSPSQTQRSVYGQIRWSF